jgi:uncharacterized protein (DUF427 family)
MKAIWNNSVIAESDDIVTVEGNAYFPLSALKRDLTSGSTTTTVCSWKGVAHYLDVVVDGKTNADAVWYYPEPKVGAEQVADRVAFWRGVTISP